MKAVLKAIYTNIPFKKEIYSLLKILWKPSEPVFKHLHFQGVFTVKINAEKKFKINHFGYKIENEIFWNGIENCWEKESLKLWIKLCTLFDIIFDVGANTGVYSLVAQTVNPRSKVYAFEPLSMFYPKLCMNIQLNHFNIKPINKAVSDVDGFTVISDYSGQAIEVRSESITLDSFIRQEGITRMGLIKIDVERHEPKVLAGFKEYFLKFKPTLIIEILETKIAEQVNEFVKDAGYLYFNIDERGSIRQTEKVQKSDYYNYLLCSAEIAAKIGLI
ncbi:MAG: FkbM family methyltransferase [Bacteroidia bacterium]|nr:FkbM family methyltransferase [Bacteroidia bacterium]MCZ2277712.1 FkbM family methyltransferase [Bacteroidia bacterium]